MRVSQRETVEYTGSILFLPMLRLSSGETSCRTSTVMHRFPTRKQRWKRGIVFPNHCVSPGSSTFHEASLRKHSPRFPPSVKSCWPDLEHILWRRAGRCSKFPSTVSTLSSVISGRGVIGPLSSGATCTVLSSLALRMSVSMRHVYQVLHLR